MRGILYFTGRVAYVGCLVAIVVTMMGISFRTMSKAHFDQIRVGMKAAEVNQILGAPPGNYVTQDHRGFFHIESLRTKGTRKKWLGDDGIVFVWFDEKDRVIDLEFEPPPWPTKSLILRIRDFWEPVFTIRRAK